MATTHNAFLDASASEGSGNEQGYDSEAAEQSKGGRSALTSQRAPKRRKLSPPESDEDGEDDLLAIEDASASRALTEKTPRKHKHDAPPTSTTATTSPTNDRTIKPQVQDPPESMAKSKPKSKPKKPGVIYLSSLPPYLRPSALRNLLTQRGFGPITRLFLTPATKSRSPHKTSKRQLYTEGWIEFASKSTAKCCAETLNAQLIGGKKGGFYHDDLWSMKYLRGMGWEELMAGVREERREEDGRRDEERLVLARETKRFVEGVEKGKKARTRAEREERGKRNGGDLDGDGDGDAQAAVDVKRTWRQFEVKGTDRTENASADMRDEPVSEDVKRVLGKIF